MSAGLFRAGSRVLDPRRLVDLVRRLRSARHEYAHRRAGLRIEKHVLEAAGGAVVAAGPFKGMRFVSQTRWNPLALYLCGSYESSLHADVERLIGRCPTTIVDVGSAEGYYAVGLALRLPGARVFAYDIDERAQQLCGDLARLNDVADRVEIRGLCTVDELERLGGPHTLMLIDCEGAELELLRPDIAPSLTTTTLIVELHDFIHPEAKATVMARFERTHRATIVDVGKAKPDGWQVLRGLRRRDRAQAVDERRPTIPHPMQWVVLTPLA